MCGFFFIKGKCERGNDCKIYHPKVCTYYKKGQCKKGRDCPFWHTPSAPAEKNNKASARPTADEDLSPPERDGKDTPRYRSDKKSKKEKKHKKAKKEKDSSFVQVVPD